MNIKILFAIIAITAIGLFVFQSKQRPEKEYTLSEVVDLHTTARGGAAAIEEINSIDIKLHIVEPEFTIDGHYRAVRDGRMRIDIFAEDKRVFTETLNSTGGWQLYADAEHGINLSEDGAAALKRGIIHNIFGIHEFEKLGYHLQLMPSEVIDRVSYYVILTVSPDGFQKKLYIDPKSFLISRTREISALHVDVDSTKQSFETLYKNYKSVNGVMFSYSEIKRDIITGEDAQNVTVQNIITNTEMDSTIFQRP